MLPSARLSQDRGRGGVDAHSAKRLARDPPVKVAKQVREALSKAPELLANIVDRLGVALVRVHGRETANKGALVTIHLPQRHIVQEKRTQRRPGSQGTARCQPCASQSCSAWA